MTTGQMMEALCKIKVADSDLFDVLTAWFEPEYPTIEEKRMAKSQAERVMFNILAISGHG